MMKKIKALISVMLIALLALLLAACSCTKPETEIEAESTVEESVTEEAEETEADIAGEYEITAMVSDGKETSSEDLELLKSKGLTCTITLESDGTGVLNLFGEESDMTWDEESISTDEKTMTYTFGDQQLTLIDGTSSLTFSRTE